MTYYLYIVNYFIDIDFFYQAVHGFFIYKDAVCSFDLYVLILFSAEKRKTANARDNMKKSFYIETFGCQMNKSDSELMAANLVSQGFLPAASEEDADIVIFNTCSVRNHAENRALSRIRTARRRAEATIVVAGCMAQRIGGTLVRDGIADVAIGPYQSPIAGDILSIYFSSKRNTFLSQDANDFEERIHPSATINPVNSWHRWVTITHGCENFCAYCIVPHVRGKLISFPSAKIFEYIRLLVSNGATEITLLGQNVNQYGQDNGDIPFYRLLEKAAQIPGIQKINFLTSHPKDFSRETVEVIRDNPNISRAIHLPLQSGSDRILALMNRRYTIGHYYKVIEDIVRILNDYAVSTDLIVGFPGETEAEFKMTIDAVRCIRFDEAFTYAYSPRESTAAYALEETLSREEKIARLNELIAVEREIAQEKLLRRINRDEKALVETISKKSTEEVMGKTFLNHPVVLPGGENDIGRMIKVKILRVVGNTLYGERIA